MFEYHALDWNDVLNRLQASATSAPGRERLADLKPLSSPDDARKSFREILEAGEVLQLGFRPHLQSLELYAVWFHRIKKKAVLKNLEIKDVRNFCLEAVALVEACSGIENSWAENLRSGMMDATEPLSAIDQILTPNGEIRSDASEALFRLFNEKEKLAREVQNALDRLVKDHQMESLLQDKYVTTREGRWVLPIRGGMQHHMPGVIHGTSHTKATVFMEPEVVIPTNNRLRQIEIEIEDEIERLLTDLSHYLTTRVDDFERTRHLMEEADVRFSEAQFTASIRGRECDFSEDSLELVELRHPMLELSGREVIPNTVSLSMAKPILLLSGPNAGGKTVLLKSVGLAAQMARCGLPICAAENSKLPFFKEVQVGIGDSQSVGEELSTFAAHLKILSKAASLRGSHNIVLIDEICGSTDPEEGSALARAFIESFANAGIFAVITSHLGPLKSGWAPDDKILNGSMEYDSRTGRPSYHFMAGLPGDSLALQTARRVGVDPAIVERAVDVLSPATRARLEGLDQIDQLKKDIGQLQNTLHKEMQSATATKKKYEKMLEDFQRQKDEDLARTVRKAEKKVDEAISHVKADDVFRRHRNLQDIKHQLPEIVKAKPINLGAPAESAEEFTKRFPPGSKVFIPSLNNDGLVQSAPNKKGEILVLSGSIRLQVHWQDLKPAHQPHNPTSDLVRRTGSISIALKDDERTLDLRGKTVDEALEELEIALDRAATQGEERLKIIHGHGTEAIKKAVRAYLSRSVSVKKWKAGQPQAGGDGITWAELANE